MRFRTTTACLCLALAAIPLNGCGDDDRSTANTLTVGLRDYAFDRLPRAITAGTPIAATNASSTEAHELTAFRLPDGETRSVSELQALPPDQLGALFPGAPLLAIAARPGAAGELIVGDGTLHRPGRYLLVCFIPVGAEPDQVLTALKAAAANPDAGPPQIDGGPPHLAEGMIAELTVTP